MKTKKRVIPNQTKKMFVGVISSEHSSVWEAGASVVRGVAGRHSLEPVDEEVRHTLATLGLSRRSSGSRCCRWWKCCGSSCHKAIDGKTAKRLLFSGVLSIDGFVTAAPTAA